MRIGNFVAFAIFLLCSQQSHALYLGVGQQGLEAGKEFKSNDFRISLSFQAMHFSSGTKTHFESREFLRLWYFYNITNREQIKFKIGASALYSPIYVYDRGYYDYQNYFAISPLAYEITLQISNSILITINEALIDIYSEQNGLDYKETRIGNFTPKFGIRYNI
jgi:hypothetical protein